MESFRKIIVGNGKISSKHLAQAKKLFQKIAITGGQKKVYVSKEIAIIASVVSGIKKAIFLTRAIPDYIFNVGRSDKPYIYSLWGGDLKSKTVFRLSADFDIRTVFDSNVGFSLLTPFGLQSTTSYSKEEISVLRSGNFYDAENILSDSSNWPPSIEYGDYDREAVFSATEKRFIDLKVTDWQSSHVPLQPRGAQRTHGIDFQREGLFVVDVQSNTYVRTNTNGFSKRIGRVVFWQKVFGPEVINDIQYKRGEFKKINTGITMPTENFLNIIGGENSQVVSSAHIIGQLYRVGRTYDECIHVTSRRFYCTLIETKYYTNNAYAVFMLCAMRTSPNTFVGYDVSWFNLRTVNTVNWRYHWLGYLRDISNTHSGFVELRHARQKIDDPNIWSVEPTINIYFADEDSDDNETHGIANAYVMFSTPNLFTVFGKTNNYPAEMSTLDVRDIYYRTFYAYMYGQEIILILGLTLQSASSPQNKMPSGILAIDINTGLTRVIYAPPEPAYVQQVIATNDGRYVYFSTEEIVDGFRDRGNMFVIDIETGDYIDGASDLSSVASQEAIPAGVNVFSNFTQPLYNR
jgi:hypothetical protein